jgi:hypothetical protein
MSPALRAGSRESRTWIRKTSALTAPPTVMQVVESIPIIVIVRQRPQGAAAWRRLPPGTAPAQPCHVRLGRRFIEEDEAGGIETFLDPAPDPAGAGDIGPGLLGSAERLFLYVSPMSAST